MVPSLLLASALLAPAAPVPPGTVPGPVGPAPRVAYLRADPDGSVHVAGYHIVKQKSVRQILVIENGQRMVKPVEEVDLVPVAFDRLLTEVGGQITTAEGAELTAAEAAQRVRGGAAVLVSADGKPVGKGWLRTVRPDTVVIASPSLTGAMIAPPQTDPRTTPAPRLVLLGAGTDGRVKIAFNPSVGVQHMGVDEVVIAGRGGVLVVGARVMPMGRPGLPGPLPGGIGAFPTTRLEEVRFEAFARDGTPVRRDDALKQLQAGGLVLIASDGRFPDGEYLKPFVGDILVLVSSELALPSALEVGGRLDGPIPPPPPLPVMPLPARIAPVPANPAPAGTVQSAPPPREKLKAEEERKPIPPADSRSDS